MKTELGDPYGDGEWELEAHDYKVVFWHHQKPEPGYTQDQMGYAELTYNVRDAVDVLEVIEWAENQAVTEDSTYCIYAWLGPEVGDGKGLLQLAGVNPTRDPQWTAFQRQHPRRS